MASLTRFLRIRSGKPNGAVAMLIASTLLSSACAHRRKVTATEAAPSGVVTVPKITSMVEMGTPPEIILGQIQRSGTVYRLTTRQLQDLRASGMPAALKSYLELTYTHATQKNPALATSDAEWHQIDGYWYGGTPFGWPRDWVVGAPQLGEKLR